MPDITYLYLPVGSPEMTEFADNWNEDLRQAGKPECPVISNESKGGLKVARRLFGGGLLKLVGTTDTLYVITHGAAEGSRYIGADRQVTRVYKYGVPRWEGVNDSEKKWTPEQFAKHLEKEGLGKGFRDLRLFACGSGLTPKSAKMPFAQALFRALRQAGYAQIEVTGYLGATRTRGANGTPAVEFRHGGGYELVPAAEYTIRFT
jgi:hypothetical protein